MNTRLLAIPIAMIVLGGGATAAAQIAADDPPADPPPIEVPTVLEDWCGFMAYAFGSEAEVPDVRTAFDRSLAAGVPIPEAAYVALLEGIPPEVEAPFSVVRSAGQALVDGVVVDDPEAVRVAATDVDAFVAANCEQ